MTGARRVEAIRVQAGDLVEWCGVVGRVVAIEKFRSGGGKHRHGRWLTIEFPAFEGRADHGIVQVPAGRRRMHWFDSQQIRVHDEAPK